jgi:DNA-binding protein H-NS
MFDMIQASSQEKSFMATSLAPLAKSKIKARAAVKNLSISELEKLISHLNAILKSEKQKEKTKADAAKKAKIAKIKALMAESGLSAADLKAGAKVGRRKKKAAPRRKAAPKYRLVIDGQEHLWSGRGRPPRVFKDYMDAGNSKESCAIKK